MHLTQDSIEQASETIDNTEVLRLSRELIRIPSITTDEHRISEFIFAKLERWGLSPKRVDVKGYGRSVIAELGRKKAPLIVLNGHMDTVEVMAGWRHDPFGARVEKGMIYGLGSLDMKCGLAAMMVAFRALAETGLPPSSRAMLQAVSGEEDSSAGTRELIRRGAFHNAKAAIVGEGFGGLGALTIGRRGGSYYDINVIGRAAHGSVPEAGINAISDAARIVQALDAMKMRRVSGLVADDFRALTESQAVLKVAGGSGTLSVPETCYLKVVRCTVPRRTDDSEDEIRRAIRSLNLRSKVDIRLVSGTADYFEPYVTAPDSVLVRTASKWIVRLTGRRPKLVVGLSEADDNRIANDLSLPVICFGPGESGELARYHQPEEAISVSQLGTAARAYFATVLDLASL